MHELAVTQSILEISLRYAQNAKATQVTDIHLLIGQLSYVVDDSVQFYWDEIAKGTPAENARLHFKRVPAELLCLDCGHRYALDGEVLACPNCMSVRVKINAGDEFHVECIDVETPETQISMEK
jgi:hydrogenase nickel incorporation protein HypA/HybF